MTKEERLKAAEAYAADRIWINKDNPDNNDHLFNEYISKGSFIAGAEAEEESLISEIKKAFAKYKNSEGCGCCSDDVAHLIAENKLGELLKVEKYSDNSGYDWNKATAS